MDKYDVNFKRLALLLLPTFWRRPLSRFQRMNRVCRYCRGDTAA